MIPDYATAYLLRRYAEDRYQQACKSKEGIGFRWAEKRAMELFCHCLERGLEIPASPPSHLRLDDEELQAGFVVARHLWHKWMEVV